MVGARSVGGTGHPPFLFCRLLASQLHMYKHEAPHHMSLSRAPFSLLVSLSLYGTQLHTPAPAPCPPPWGRRAVD
jgi:hypothetical protein